MIDERPQSYRNVHQLALRSVRKVPFGRFFAVHVDVLTGSRLLRVTVQMNRVGSIRWNDLVGKE